MATADPLRLVPYIDMVFSPTIVPWLCLTGVKETLSDMGTVDEVRAFAHLPVIESAELAGCPRPKFWNDWFDHQKEDAYWRSLSVERRLNRVTVPVLGIAGWYDDARGTIRNDTATAALPKHPLLRVDTEPPLDFFIVGDNTWRHEREWPLARTASPAPASATGSTNRPS